MNIESIVGDRLSEARTNVTGILHDHYEPDEARIIIARYTAAFAVNFTDWIGKTLAWARHERAQYALKDNLRCEQVEDHVTMLLNFANAAGVIVQPTDHKHVEGSLKRIRDGFTDVTNAGIYGTAILTYLEVTSQMFIPALERAGRALDLTTENLDYTRTHGQADIEHARALTAALIAECSMHDTPIPLIVDGFIHAHSLLQEVFRPN